MIGRLLVVDDEAWFREGLIKLIGNHQLGWEVVGEASDGEEALAVIEGMPPDLVITDINMPVMDGLALCGRLAEQYPDVSVIILTGYRDFEYARQALRYGAAEFLLKPLALDETCRVLRKAYEQMRLRKAEQRAQEREKQASFLQGILLGLPCSPAGTEAFEGIGKDRELWLLRVESFCPEGKSYSSRDEGLLHYAVSNMAEELLQLHRVAGFTLPMRKDEYAFMLEPGDDAADYRRHLAAAVQELIGLRTSWLPGGLLRTAEEAGQKYEQMRSGSPADKATVHVKTDSSYELREELLSMLVTGSLQEAEKRITSHIRQASSLPLADCKAQIYTLTAVFFDILTQDFKHLRACSYEDLKPGAILLMDTAEELESWALAKGRDFIALFTGWMQEKQDNVVQRAIRYIETHYHESCSLQSAAAYVHVTPNYLSNLFKKETGTGFTNYVNTYRVEKAKALLAGSRLRMTEIAGRTGFDNASYFTAVFKQLTGRSPSEYRKEQGRD
ncbi:response regulator transcription factor [Paenibacillus tarimensis]|uniref:response regulator transcription factor n=1 Tax=Paenibacillus tarimensis TaxID=416012 RepID=UPI001F27606A|nr:response regulator [Paenibacillus tarimensis]MCF2943027.1 response regulator [Paenibacillus tarimensis]